MKEIEALISRWLRAVREQDLEGIRAGHDPDILMFDVPPPFVSRGLEAYMATWDLFYANAAKPVQFELRDMAITAGEDVAFATALGRCCDLSSGTPTQLDFRLTMGFQRKNGQWRIVHEHHSLPASN